MTCWWKPNLSLAAEVHMEADRRQAAHLSRDELSALADRLIQCWYHQHAVIQAATKEIAGHELKSQLQQAPADRHLHWAREILQQ